MATLIHFNPNFLSHKLNNNNIKHVKKYPSNVTQGVSFIRVKAVLGVSGRQLIESGTIRAVQPKDATALMKSEGCKLLDIRPEWEREKARVIDSLHVPLFVKDMDNSVLTWIKKWVHFGYIGLWTGQKFTAINPEFVSLVNGVVTDKDVMLLVACGEGLRSMMAVSKLHEAGYKNLGWLAGGFNRARDEDFHVEGSEKLQYATIGGVSYYFLKLLLLLQVLDNST